MELPPAQLSLYLRKLRRSGAKLGFTSTQYCIGTAPDQQFLNRQLVSGLEKAAVSETNDATIVTQDIDISKPSIDISRISSLEVDLQRHGLKAKSMMILRSTTQFPDI